MLLDSDCEAKELRLTAMTATPINQEVCFMSEKQLTRREVLKKAAYVAPVIVTMKANFAFASAGSGDYTEETKPTEYLGHGNQKDKHDETDNNEKKHAKDNMDNNDKKNWTNKTRF